MTRADDSDPSGKPPGETPFRFDSGTVRLGTLGAPAPQEGAAPAAAPASPPASMPRPQQEGAAVDPDAELAAHMARIQQRLDRLKAATAPAAPGAAELPAGTSGAPVSGPAPKPGLRRPLWLAAALGLFAALAVILAYLAVVVPGPWFPESRPQSFSGASLRLVGGQGEQVGGELVVSAPAEDGVTIVSVDANLRADRFRAVAWSVSGIPENAKVGIAWRSDAQPGRTQGLPAIVEGGRMRPVIVADAPGWIGTISGLGLVVSGRLVAPLRITGVTAKPMGAMEILRDRAGEWLAFEGWSGTSVNVVAGGADAQDLPLTPLVAVVVALGAALLLGLHRWKPQRVPEVAAGVACLFLVGWFVLDLRWTANLVRQVATTWQTFGGKSEREKRLADVDGQLYLFIENVRTALPATPQRVWVVSDAPYFSGRAAYQLYPHNVHFQARGRALPERDWVKPGDWLLVFNRRGVEFSETRRTLRWDGSTEVAAEMKVAGPGAALFQVK